MKTSPAPNVTDGPPSISTTMCCLALLVQLLLIYGLAARSIETALFFRGYFQDLLQGKPLPELTVMLESCLLSPRAPVGLLVLFLTHTSICYYALFYDHIPGRIRFRFIVIIAFNFACLLIYIGVFYAVLVWLPGFNPYQALGQSS
ncbi:MAG: hypothetical protein ACAI35_18160 [Candidatus Methylacidiphilales bacterium]|nr:hypothetical protein [Candidatus Methylacidiphilales bacterium]